MVLNSNYNEQTVKEALERKLSGYFGADIESATEKQMYKAVIMTVKDILAEKRGAFKEETKRQKAKKTYYLCMEFLIGPSLMNNLRNLGLENTYRKVLSDIGYDLSKIAESEPDPALGNGGLGRLAA